MRNLDQLIAKTPKNRLRSAKYVKLLAIKKGYSKGKAFIACRSKSIATINPFGHVIPSYDPHVYVTIITFLDKKLNVSVGCSCGDFTFRSEVALHERGAAEIKYSNSEMPTTTNPSMVPQICKHLVALRYHLKDKLGV